MRTSLRRRLYTSFVFLLTYALLVVIASVAINYSMRGRFRSLMDRNEVFASLLAQQTELQNSFQEGLRSEEPAAQARLAEMNGKMDGYIERASSGVALTREGRTHLRVMRNMYGYYVQNSTELLERESLTPADYAEISFLTLLLRQMSQEAQELAVVEYRSNMETFAADFRRVERQESIALAALGVFVLVFGGLAIRSINHVLASAHKLIEATASFKDGSILQEDFPTTGYVELDAIGSAFNSMKDDIHRYIEELHEKSKLEVAYQKEHLENEQKDRLLKQAQLDFLRSQINPHFLFNTLNIIGKSTVLEDSERSLELIEAISLILRYTLEHDESLVSLSEELEIVQAYLFIQQARFSSRLTYDINVSEDTAAIRVPSVILQPLVENSIKHGLERTRETVHIDVEVRQSENAVVMSVRDNGPGHVDSTHAPLPGMGIGMSNLERRLELRYGRGDLISRKTVPGKGTVVRVVLPRKKVP